MATIVAQATGNWSAGATWTGGVKPGPGDIAQSGNFVVTIDENVVCATIESTGTGYFVASTAGLSITANITTSHTTSFQSGLRISNTSGTITITGNITGGNVNYCHCVSKSGSGVLSIVGDISGGDAGNYALSIGQVTTITITGNVIGGSATGSIGIYTSVASTITVSGSATGGSGNQSYGIRNGSTGSVFVGTVVGGSGLQAVGLIGENSTGSNTFSVLRFGPNGNAPVAGWTKLAVSATTNYIRVKRSDTGADYDLSNDYPDVANVKTGVSYQLGTKTGTLNNTVIVIED